MHMCVLLVNFALAFASCRCMELGGRSGNLVGCNIKVTDYIL